MRSQLTFLDPAILLAAAEAEKAPVPSEELFNNPAHKPLLDRWCAASFSVGYQKHVTECQVAMAPGGSREDFFLSVGGYSFPFQTTEVQEPGRTRGLEYRGPPTLTPYRPGEIAENAPRWLEAGVQKKADKHYAQSGGLNLLVYANFNSRLEWTGVTRALMRFQGTFASLWLIAYDVIGTVFSTPKLGAIGNCVGWAQLRAGPNWETV